MTYKTEFPDFGELDVAVPSDFEDTSWHNDVCPSFRSSSRGFLLYIDYADEEKREFPEDKARFTVERMIGDTFTPDNSNVTTLLFTDDWNAVLALINFDFAAKIETIDSAKTWITNLHKAGMMFHFEDDPASIICGADGTKPLFTAEQSTQIRERVSELYTFDWGDLECPIGFALTLLRFDA